MPHHPLWLDRLDSAIEQLASLSSPWVDRATLEFVLGVSRRRAQQILAPLVRKTIGRNGLADRDELIEHLRRHAVSETAYYEGRRRERLHNLIDHWHQQAREQPTVLVKAPTAVLQQELDSLPPGISLEAGRIVIEGFRTGDEARQLLLALVLAMGRNPVEFDARITPSTTVSR